MNSEWPDDPTLLGSPMHCPACFAQLTSARCQHCGINLDHTQAQRLLDLGKQMIAMEAERQRTLQQIRADGDATAKAEMATQQPVGQPTGAPDQSVEHIQPAELNQLVQHEQLPQPSEKVVSTPPVAQPTAPLLNQPAPQPAPQRVAQTAAAEPRRSPVQTLLLIAGVSLLGIAVIFFLFLAYLMTTLGVRIALTIGLGGLVMLLGAWLRKREQVATGSAVIGFGFFTSLVSLWALRLVPEAFFSTVDLPFFNAAVCLVGSALAWLLWRLGVKMFSFPAVVLGLGALQFLLFGLFSPVQFAVQLGLSSTLTAFVGVLEAKRLDRSLQDFVVYPLVTLGLATGMLSILTATWGPASVWPWLLVLVYLVTSGVWSYLTQERAWFYLGQKAFTIGFLLITVRVLVWALAQEWVLAAGAGALVLVLACVYIARRKPETSWFARVSRGATVEYACVAAFFGVIATIHGLSLATTRGFELYGLGHGDGMDWGLVVGIAGLTLALLLATMSGYLPRSTQRAGEHLAVVTGGGALLTAVYALGSVLDDSFSGVLVVRAGLLVLTAGWAFALWRWPRVAWVSMAYWLYHGFFAVFDGLASTSMWRWLMVLIPVATAAWLAWSTRSVYARRVGGSDSGLNTGSAAGQNASSGRVSVAARVRHMFAYCVGVLGVVSVTAMLAADYRPGVPLAAVLLVGLIAAIALAADKLPARLHYVLGLSISLLGFGVAMVVSRTIPYANLLWLTALFTVAVVFQIKRHFRDDFFALAAAALLPFITELLAPLPSLGNDFLLDYGAPLGLLALSAGAYWWFTQSDGQVLKRSARIFMASVAVLSVLLWLPAQSDFTRGIHHLLLATVLFITAHITSNAIKSADIFSKIIWLTPVNVVLGIWAFLRHWGVPLSEYYSIALTLVLAGVFVMLVTMRPRAEGERATGRSFVFAGMLASLWLPSLYFAVSADPITNLSVILGVTAVVDLRFIAVLLTAAGAGFAALWLPRVLFGFRMRSWLYAGGLVTVFLLAAAHILRGQNISGYYWDYQLWVGISLLVMIALTWLANAKEFELSGGTLRIVSLGSMGLFLVLQIVLANAHLVYLGVRTAAAGVAVALVSVPLVLNSLRDMSVGAESSGGTESSTRVATIETPGCWIIAAYTLALSFREPGLWVALPVAVAVLTWVALRAMARDEGVRSLTVWSPALLAALLPILSHQLQDRVALPLVLLGGAYLLGATWWGTQHRHLAPYGLGLLGVIILALTQLWPAISILYALTHWWIWIGIAGAALIYMAARYEKQMQRLRHWGQQLRQFR